MGDATGGVVVQVREHNEAIWPQVTIAQAAQCELDRTKAFIEHIRSAALPLAQAGSTS